MLLALQAKLFGQAVALLGAADRANQLPAE